MTAAIARFFLRHWLDSKRVWMIGFSHSENPSMEVPDERAEILENIIEGCRRARGCAAGYDADFARIQRISAQVLRP